jgi:formylglycine-generating enzyme required for sulfatase activity
VEKSYEGKYRVLRGGSWDSGVLELHSAFRNWNDSDMRNIDYGFRVARDF